MKNQDKSRKWMWWFLGAVVAMQLYFVRELLAAFALFALVFAVFGAALAGIYLLHQGWAVAVERVAESKHPAVAYAKRGVNSVEELARRGATATLSGAEELAKRAVRRTGSAAAR
ncbi:MAG TPA: hypothetical protein VMT51_00475 [Dongiaceae bacterium]|nr:hypothetical protein [Dongiaceae bacterium]